MPGLFGSIYFYYDYICFFMGSLKKMNPIVLVIGWRTITPIESRTSLIDFKDIIYHALRYLYLPVNVTTINSYIMIG